MTTMHADDIFELPQGPNEAVCITTNGIVKTNGRAVMGRGIALEADKRFQLSALLGAYLRQFGNRAFWMGTRKDTKTGRHVSVVTFPTKRDWRDPSELELIRRSCEQVTAIADKFGLKRVYLPCPGCANGGLDWETQVKPVIEPLLDDRFVVADRRI